MLAALVSGVVATAAPASAATGSLWTQLSPATSPSARSGASIAYDPATGQTVLFGGNANGTAQADTWSWSGTTWTALTPATSPPARYNAALAYDGSTDQLLLFGGYNGSTYLSDTWAWTGTTWTELTPTTSPSLRAGASLAYDPVSGGQMLLFGGYNGSTYLTRHVVLERECWTQIDDSPVNSPPLGGQPAGPRGGFLRLRHLPVPDGPLRWLLRQRPRRHLVLDRHELVRSLPDNVPAGALWGADGLQPGARGTGTVRGTGQPPITPTPGSAPGQPGASSARPHPPLARVLAAMTYDPATSQMVLFGGYNGTSYLGDTWQWSAVAVTAVSPIAGPAAGGGSVTITGIGFNGVTAVQFGSTNATSYSVTSSTQIVAVAPAESVGTVNITVTNPANTSAISSADQFTYEAAPTVTALSPTSGALVGGTSVTITGTNLTGATAVDFGVQAATAYTVVSQPRSPPPRPPSLRHLRRRHGDDTRGTSAPFGCRRVHLRGGRTGQPTGRQLGHGTGRTDQRVGHRGRRCGHGHLERPG